jgi:Deoxyribonuclease NucA/NucB
MGAPLLALLTRGPNSEAPGGSEAQAARWWYKNLPECRAAEPGQDCDEYPFYSTTLGGPALNGRPAGDIRPITARDNRSQGASLNAFYRRCNVTNGVSIPVLPIDNDLVPTFGYCVKP